MTIRGIYKLVFHRALLPHYCAVWVERRSRIVCAAHSLPVHVRVRDAILPAALAASVATLPEYRVRGIMRAMLTEHLRRLRSLGTPLVILPAGELCNLPLALPLSGYGQVLYCSSLLRSAARADTGYPGDKTGRRGKSAGCALPVCMCAPPGDTAHALLRSFADFALKYATIPPTA